MQHAGSALVYRASEAEVYRNVLVARTLVATLRQYKDTWEAQLVERGERELALLAQLRHLAQE